MECAHQQRYLDSVQANAPIDETALAIIGELERALLALIDEPQPLGIDRPAYQAALKLIDEDRRAA